MRRAELLSGFILVVVAFWVSATGFAEERNDLPAFDRINTFGHFAVEIKMGADQQRVSIDGKDLDEIELLEVREGELVIVQSRRALFGGRLRDLDLVFRIDLPKLEELDLAGGVSVGVFEFEGSDLKAELSTGAGGTFTGQCGTLAIDMSTGAQLDSRKLACAQVQGEVSTGANASVSASQKLDFSASTGGRVRVHGKPTEVKTQESTGGSIRVLGR